MLIYTQHSSPRLRYVLNFIFSEGFGVDFRITESKEEFGVFGGPKINYSTSDFDGSFHVPHSGFLSEKGVHETDPGLEKTGSMPVLFHTSRIAPGSDRSLQNKAGTSAGTRTSGLGFDLFSAVFYMISRYEEYLPFEGDRYGRFPAALSLAAKQGFLGKPVVDLWSEDLRQGLLKRFHGLQLRRVDFNFLPTCDVDVPFAYLHRGRIRTIGARARAGVRGSDDPKLRREVLGGKKKDPFDTFSEIEAIHSLHRTRPVVFFLTSGYGPHDKSISPRSRVFSDLVRQTMNYADVGIHPSYRASGDAARLRKEVRMLSGITGEPMIRSRQHYLKFSLPASYRNYLGAGIREEYSMGFASAAGFRAGTARKFFFYDLPGEEETTLRVVPFQVMDRTLKDYMNLSPQQALVTIMSLADATRRTGGTFASIWHNDAFSDHGEWNGWKDVYLQMIDTLAT